MTDDMVGPADDPVADLQDLVRQRFLEGLVRQLERSYPEAGYAKCEDAVCEAAARLVERLRKPPAITDVRSYISKIAHNVLKNSAQRVDNHERPLDEHDDHAMPSAEAEALRFAALEAIKAEIKNWENAHIREVMLVTVEAVAIGEPIELAEIAEIAGQNLGEELSLSSVAVWKSRGLKKLRDSFKADDSE
jgi:DNA-directed RNA polymerase specialized sigma24 family protein